MGLKHFYLINFIGPFGLYRIRENVSSVSGAHNFEYKAGFQDSQVGILFHLPPFFGLSFSMLKSITGLANYKLPNITPSNAGILFVSAKFNKAEIENIHESILQQSQTNNIIGAVVDGVSNPMGWTLLSFEQARAAAFGRGSVHRQKQVGRWPSQLNANLPAQKFQSISQSPFAVNFTVPPNWAGMKPTAFITISDQEPHDHYRFLNREYPNVPVIGIVGARTPFINGKDFTIFNGDSCVDGGAVVLALTTPIKMETSFNNVVPISEYFAITRAQGNILLEIEDMDAAGVMIDAVREVGSAGFTLVAGLKDESGVEKLVKVLGGDITKGGLALDLSSDLSLFNSIRFMRPSNSELSNNLTGSTFGEQPSAKSNSLIFDVIDENMVFEPAKVETYNDDSVTVQTQLGIPVAVSGQFHFHNVPGTQVKLLI